MRWQTGARVALVVILAAPTCLDGLREDEVQCEEAVAHLDSCCTAFDLASVSCIHEGHCDATYPDLTVRESQCIRDLTCQQVVDRNLCNRVPDAVVDPWGEDAGAEGAGASAERPSLCP